VMKERIDMGDELREIIEDVRRLIERRRGFAQSDRAADVRYCICGSFGDDAYLLESFVAEMPGSGMVTESRIGEVNLEHCDFVPKEGTYHQIAMDEWAPDVGAFIDTASADMFVDTVFEDVVTGAMSAAVARRLAYLLLHVAARLDDR